MRKSTIISESTQLEGKKLCIWGAGVEGEALLRYLRTKVRISGEIVVLDEHIENKRSAWLAKNYRPVRFERDPTKVDCEVLLRSPGVSPYGKAWKTVMVEQSPPYTSSGTALWLGDKQRRARTVGVTGTKGKTTCTALLKMGLKMLGHTTSSGGNSADISLLDMEDAQYSIAELSSFQAVELSARLRPDTVLLTNLYNAHADWHGDHAQYVRDKLKLCAKGRKKTLTLCNANDVGTLKHLGNAKHVTWYGDERGIHMRGQWIYMGNTQLSRFANPDLYTPHMRDNVCGVVAVLVALERARGTVEITRKTPGWDAMFTALENFRGVSHRQEYIGQHHGRHYIDDSAATVPEATLAALRSCHRRYGEDITLLLGGQEHTQDYEYLALELRRFPKIRVVLLPDNGKYLGEMIKSRDVYGKSDANGVEYGMPILFAANNLSHGVRWAQANTPIGGVILLSPSAPSLGRFKNYVARSELFCKLALAKGARQR